MDREMQSSGSVNERDRAAAECREWHQEFDRSNNQAEKGNLQVQYNNHFCTFRLGVAITEALPELEIVKEKQ